MTLPAVIRDERRQEKRADVIPDRDDSDVLRRNLEALLNCCDCPVKICASSGKHQRNDAVAKYEHFFVCAPFARDKSV